MERTEVVTAQNVITQQIQQEQEAVNQIQDVKQREQRQIIIDAKKLLIDVIPTFNTNSAVKKFEDLTKPEIKKQVMEAVVKQLTTGQLNVFAPAIAKEAEEVYETLVTDTRHRTIEIPRMDLVQGEVSASFDDFDLVPDELNYQPLTEEIVVIGIGVGNQSYDTIPVQTGVDYGSPSKLLISELINFSEVDYDENADLLHKLAKAGIGRNRTAIK